MQIPHETIDPNETFIDAITNSRNEFVIFIDALPWDVQLRTKCESLLIIYDQMKQFIIDNTPPDPVNDFDKLRMKNINWKSHDVDPGEHYFYKGIQIKCLDRNQLLFIYGEIVKCLNSTMESKRIDDEMMVAFSQMKKPKPLIDKIIDFKTIGAEKCVKQLNELKNKIDDLKSTDRRIRDARSTTYGSTFMKMITKIKSWLFPATSPWIDCGMFENSGNLFLIQMKIQISNNRKSFRRVNLGFVNSPGRYPDIFKSVMDVNIKSDANPIS